MNTVSDYHVLKAIFDALKLNLVGEALLHFVQGSTKCTEEQFERIYNEVQEAWNN